MKAVVLKTANSFATVLTDDGQFKTVKDRGYQPGQRIRTASRKLVTSLVSAAACMLLVCGGLVSWFAPAGYVYMDINPSLRIQANCFGRVLSVAALNDDAERILSSDRYVGITVDACMNRVVENCKRLGYMEENADIQIDICTANGTLNTLVYNATENIESETVSVSLYAVTEDDNEVALHSNISTGRVRAIKSYTNIFGGTFEENKEKLKNVKTKEILHQIQEYRRSTKGDDRTVEDGTTVRYISERRLKAVQAYTEAFGGTLEENMRMLRGTTSKEIYAMLEEGATEP